MGKRQKPEPEPVIVDGVTIDACWYNEWVASGFQTLRKYLDLRDQFDAWCDTHNPPHDQPLD